MWYSWWSSPIGAELGDEDLDLERLHLVGEDLAEVLGVDVRERARVDVLAADRRIPWCRRGGPRRRAAGRTRCSLPTPAKATRS